MGERIVQRAVWLTIGVLALALAAAAQQPTSVQTPSLSPQQLAALAAQGRELFTGHVRFQNRGPACAACHSVGALGFPNGGTLGPDLTHVYAKMGTQGVASALKTLYFPAMFPLYETHPLTPDEQTALAAFLQSADQGQPASATPRVLGIAVIIFLILLAITGFVGRNRLRGVRHPMVAAAHKAPRRADLQPTEAKEP